VSDAENFEGMKGVVLLEITLLQHFPAVF